MEKEKQKLNKAKVDIIAEVLVNKIRERDLHELYSSYGNQTVFNILFSFSPIQITSIQAGNILVLRGMLKGEKKVSWSIVML